MARRFTKISDCRRYMASLLNRIEKGELEATASVRGYLTNILAGLIKDSELERRIEALEQAQEGQQ